VYSSIAAATTVVSRLDKAVENARCLTGCWESPASCWHIAPNLSRDELELRSPAVSTAGGSRVRWGRCEPLAGSVERRC